jgi:hypothetical protein
MKLVNDGLCAGRQGVEQAIVDDQRSAHRPSFTSFILAGRSPFKRRCSASMPARQCVVG